MSYDDILKMDVPEHTYVLVGFADDLALLIVAQKSNVLARVVNPTLDAIGAWMAEHGL